jgi:hypothetical protein
MSTVQGGQGNIVTNGLVLNLDAANPRSYPQPYNGTTWQNLVAVSSSISGSLTNGVGYTGSNGGSIVFDGTNDYIILPTITNNIYTIDFWHRMAGNDGTYGYFASSGDNGLAISEGGNVDGLVYGQFYYWNGLTINLLGTIPSTTNWNHICALINTSTNNIQMYGNGNQLSTTTVTSMSTSIINIGRYITANLNFLKGNLASYKIYNRALSASEVLQNFNATRARFGI